MRLGDHERRHRRHQPRAEFVRLGPAGADLAPPGVMLENQVLQTTAQHHLLVVAQVQVLQGVGLGHSRRNRTWNIRTNRHPMFQLATRRERFVLERSPTGIAAQRARHRGRRQQHWVKQVWDRAWDPGAELGQAFHGQARYVAI